MPGSFYRNCAGLLSYNWRCPSIPLLRVSQLVSQLAKNQSSIVLAERKAAWVGGRAGMTRRFLFHRYSTGFVLDGTLIALDG